MRLFQILLLSALFVVSPIDAKADADSLTVKERIEFVEDGLNNVDFKLEQYHSVDVEAYNRLSSELSRDFTWLGIVIAVFSLLIGVVVPLIINGEYKKQYEREIRRNNEIFEEKLRKEDLLLQQFESNFKEFKQGYEIRYLMEKAYDMENRDERIAIYNRVLSIDPKYETALLRRGIAYRYKEKYSDSISDFNVLIEIDPNNYVAFNNLGYTYQKAEDYPRAIEKYDKALELNPVYPTVLYRKAVALTDLNKLEEALSSIDKAIAQSPDSKTYHVRRRRILRRMSPTKYADEIKKENDIIQKLEDEAAS